MIELINDLIDAQIARNYSEFSKLFKAAVKHAQRVYDIDQAHAIMLVDRLMNEQTATPTKTKPIGCGYYELVVG